MARARNIKPGFFINDQLAEIEPLGRLLFAGLWTIADREGRLEDRPKKIKVAILPYDDCNIDQLLNTLNNAGFISRYTIDGQNYIQIINFLKHQNPHPREVASVIPAQTFLATDKATPRHGLSNTLQLPSNADSPIPITIPSDSLIPFPIKEAAEETISELEEGNKTCPYSQIVELYHKNCAGLSRVIKITDGRKKHMNARWEEYDHDIGIFEKLFLKAGASVFLNGGGDTGFKADFEWLILPNNMPKVLEGRYDNKNKASPKNKDALIDSIFEELEANGSE